MTRHIALVLNAPTASERTTTAIKLAEQLLARGHRVSVFAHDHAVALSAGTSPLATAVRRLIRQGVHGATLDWVIEGDAARALGVADAQVPGVVEGDHGDLWALVRAADVTLGVGVDG